jgi:hypothetical protein
LHARVLAAVFEPGLLHCAVPPAVSGNPARIPFKGNDMTKLITEEQRAQLLANGRQSIDHPNFDPRPVVKLFTPDTGATWLLTEIDPDDDDHAHGLCDLGQGFPELGWVSLAELRALHGPLRLPVERDLYFQADKSISVYAREARMAGRIVA